MRLYIVRHAAAEERGIRWPNDADRPLTEEGRKRFRRLVEKLSDRGFRPSIIATSPYMRAFQTAEVMAKYVGGDPEVVKFSALEPDSKLGDLLRWSENRDDEQIAWIGHMPDVAELTAELIGTRAARIGFSKGAIAAIDFEDRPAPGRGILCWLATARLLDC